MAEKEQFFLQNYGGYTKSVNMIHPYFQFKLLKSRIILLKTETVLNNKTRQKVLLGFLFADR